MRISGRPLVSVIICTYNRHIFVRRALESVLRQDLKDFEIIIVDDGSDPQVEFPANLQCRIRLIRTKHRGVGAARSEGLNATQGEFVAYCDDDDEWRPNHLETLLRYLMEHREVDLVYGDSEWVQDGSKPFVAYSLDYDGFLLSHINYVFASDVMHRASAAREVGGFDRSLQAYEDWDLWLRMSHRQTLWHLPVIIGSHHWHENCVSAGDQHQDWQRVYQNHQCRLSAAGAEAAHDLKVGTCEMRSFDHDTWQGERRELIWHSMLRANEGYGSVGRQLLLAVERQSVKITMAPTRNQPPRTFERFYRPLRDWGRFGFYYDYRVQPSVLKCERIINYSMWESTLVPQAHIDEINRAAALQYVPCQQNLESFRECGLRVPLKILHHGVDPDRFPYLQRCHSEVFSFGTYGNLSHRKGIDILIRAFCDEFSPAEPVRLLLKSTELPVPALQATDPRILFSYGSVGHDKLLEFLQRLDSFILPSRGEGFGLCGLEAMATGLPLIATNWSGPAEYLDAEYSYPLSYRLIEANGIESNHVRYFGQWAEPDYEHLRYLMRWIYEHPPEAKEKGRIAAERVREKWTWDRIAKQMCADLDEIANG